MVETKHALRDKLTEKSKYTFFKIPKFLFKDDRFKDLSCEAKLLYGLMLDRVHLSMMNRYYDREDGRFYIYYTLESITESLGCCEKTAVKRLRELKECNLIEISRQKKGRPSQIYVADADKLC